MAKRGRKPIDIRMLNLWEFEWYKALHLLRDGTQLPSDPTFERVNRKGAAAQLEWWKKAKLEEILGDMLRRNPPAFSELAKTHERVSARKEWVERERRWLKEWAELDRQGAIVALEWQLKPRKIHALAERRKIWDAFIQARTVAAVQDACEQWKSLRDVQLAAMTCFADHVLVNVKEFLRMKRNRRIPRSSYADESRLEYLARGMAGVIVGVSPMTAIERLRNLKHGPGGPLWSEAHKHCECWRCEKQRWRNYYEEIEKEMDKGANQ